MTALVVALGLSVVVLMVAFVAVSAIGIRACLRLSEALDALQDCLDVIIATHAEFDIGKDLEEAADQAVGNALEIMGGGE